MKKEMEQKWKDLQGLKATISKYESHLRGGHEDDLSDSEAEGTMAITPVADNTPSVSTAPESLASPLGGEQTHTMEVDDGDEYQAPASPVSPREDDLLTGNAVVGVEGEMANLMVSSPREGKGGDKGASIKEALSISLTNFYPYLTLGGSPQECLPDIYKEGTKPAALEG